ncbi:MAG: hypothetical protein KJ905_01325 [Nanoarchaeota archaeon]|nr:hypothetical protein [Nanoarchaeota archaeon]MBU1501400.1 hypothetical protein [Nanoarchaeota archaeon]MBU2459059.1 hypothetical protein [Nanoarchaeota archaeon]
MAEEYQVNRRCLVYDECSRFEEGGEICEEQFNRPCDFRVKILNLERKKIKRIAGEEEIFNPVIDDQLGQKLKRKLFWK